MSEIKIPVVRHILIRLKSSPALLIAGVFLLLAGGAEFVVAYIDSHDMDKVTKSLPEHVRDFQGHYKDAENSLVATGTEKALGENLPLMDWSTVVREQGLYQHDIKVFPHNPFLGNGGEVVRLVVFTDLACGSCRQEVEKVLDSIPNESVSIVFKFLPFDGNSVNGGIYTSMAEYYSAFSEFLKRSFNKNGNLVDISLVELAELAGVSLDDQRKFMTNKMDATLKNLRQDALQARMFGVVSTDLPVMFVDGFRIGNNNHELDPAKLPAYINWKVSNQD